MDIPSTGPTSLRSNYTDDAEESKEEDLPEDPKTGDKYATLTTSEALSDATLIYSK